MPVGYLLTVVFLATGTLCALKPLRRPLALARPGFLLGVVFVELPFLFLALLALASAVAAAGGDLDGFPGTALAVAAGATAAGLAVVAVRGLRDRGRIRRAVAEGLGARWQAAAETRPGRRLRGRTPARALLGPFFRRHRHVRHVADLPYGDAGPRQLLDVYHHRALPTGAPVLVHLHGGSFLRGRKDTQSLPLLHRLAADGWLCVSANYRLRPTARHPDELVDAKRILAWVRAHAHEYGGDPATLVVSGSSAGGHIAAMAALTAGDREFQPGFEDADTSVSAAVCLGAYYGTHPDGGPRSAPPARITADAPPFLVAHGDQDTLVPVESARAFAARLRATSASPVVLAELRGGHHAFDLFHSPRFEALIDGIAAFAAALPGARDTNTDGERDRERTPGGDCA
ncbi:alpha/beta hydrolase [Streptomyces sp. Z26]|uniref:alpha/beta hydrolase n=1 Tax=Streptomyces sp. Z26 TaxID=2500177 RepID=UPI000EF16C9C|nr:alpha/beta hydrolase [Streptomyces sp. Z26]RLL70063.1 alpha/beta hydrolase [Streptomyces sp. Z26]